MRPFSTIVDTQRNRGYLLSFWKSLLRVAGVLTAVAVLTWIDFRLINVNSATAAFTFLVLILGLATRTKLWESSQPQ